MKFLPVVAGLELIAQVTLAVPGIRIPSVREAAETLQKRQSSIIVTTGANGTSVQPRLEIRQMMANAPNQWTLFILAMQAFQARSQSDAGSYYQIAGIHGVPRQNYNGVGQCSTCGDADGYCTHDSVLFPGWHRAYLALFEQQLLSVANQIAASYPASQQATMVAAAAKLRLPYWDWAAEPRANYPTLASSISNKYVTVNGPKGSTTINNPLFRHDFQDTSGMVYSPFNGWPVTLRSPNSNAASASSQENQVISAFDSIRPSMQDQVYQLFSTCSDFEFFSNDDAGSSSTSCSNSLEGIHNTIHVTAGGSGSSTVFGGHMTYLAVAAFDPIFWLHHCNVDRLFAMWQALHPNSYGASQPAPHDTWTIKAGSTQGADSPLTPFYKDTNGNFWTTNQVRHWDQAFHYTYPEFSNSDGSSTAIASYINQLYGPSATATAGSSKRTSVPEPAGMLRNTFQAAPAAYRLQARQETPTKAQNGSLYQYVANIHSPRYALNGSYNIYLFDGNPASEVPTSWISDVNLIGPMGVLSQPGMTSKELVAAGSIPLTRTLTNKVNQGVLASLSEADVVPYLQYSLIWRVAGPNGTQVDPATIPQFDIAVYASTASPPSEFGLPQWSRFIPLVDVTQGKAGGANITTANGTVVRRASLA
ncbi:hypothetical protein BAUCODRAFT_68232 [Baudoinia panamericana UAMH 10762]|uniref:tyrosinase n=1 Tax=Baudoinia panamericana (strain UAMH 10762) TaxID=717646 RepID=M2NEU0_BAUPA|nr:uncharacterized protein BAUCODRAFT_68232 [Baudoinia panamericana UAMH 10762]EMC97480.1 hypothetical protein BAUCODRAFT_68232 [Baudoinia panamericana UAMH 10762]